MFSKVLKESYIQLNVEVDNFEDAILVATKPLLEDGVVTQKYVDSILEIYRETGPYIVITKNVALPHAPSDRGALSVAISITTLKNPVKSGNEANDPVKFLFSLSAPDSNSHLEVLSDLVAFLSDETFCPSIESATSAREVIEIVRKYEKEGI